MTVPTTTAACHDDRREGTAEPLPESRACGLYPNQGMHRNAAFIASLHPRAVEYLEQAPVLAAAFGVKANTRADRLYVASRIGGPISRGERLRSVMAAVQIPGPLRKLTGYAVVPYMAEFVRELNDLHPSVISQAVPAKGSAQRRWLASLREYRSRMRARYRSPKIGFAWVAQHAQQFERDEAGDFADFVAYNPSTDFSRWTLAQMRNQVELWHDRLAADQSLTKYGIALTPSTVIDLSDWPDHAEVAGFEFFKLATPGMLMEEGRRMRHCVASYIPRVMDGDCHIYSIQADMRRMATLEIVGQKVRQLKAFGNRVPSKAVETAAQALIRDHRPGR